MKLRSIKLTNSMLVLSKERWKSKFSIMKMDQ